MCAHFSTRRRWSYSARSSADIGGLAPAPSSWQSENFVLDPEQGNGTGGMRRFGVSCSPEPEARSVRKKICAHCLLLCG